MSSELHNRLASAYQTATHDLLTDAAASTYLDDLAALLALWSNAMACAQRGDASGAAEAIEQAASLAREADRRPIRGLAFPIVRASKISKR